MTDTQRKARQYVAPAAGKIKARVLEAIRAAGSHGLTDHEIAERLGAYETTSRSKRVELRDEGEILDSGRRRRGPRGVGMIVWIAKQTKQQAGGPACPRCGSTRRVDVVVHAGRSTRRDCARCGRFLTFARWHESEEKSGGPADKATNGAET